MNYRELFSAIAQFPYNLVHALHYPLTSANIYVHRVDIHFDEFRVSIHTFTMTHKPPIPTWVGSEFGSNLLITQLIYRSAMQNW